ncbi:MAG: alanine--tRNA ligase [Pseudomonadales bacterium]|nr:alanine--tRNA ligase [Pseudomonadales bacterium]
MKTSEVRDAYLGFFEERDHKVVDSSSLVPSDDPTLLFTNAGMNQFKDPLLGRSDPGYKRAVTSQRCVRAGGKHNDLENVGYTARHHTFFEMLGNFSFGDYFKEETISWAWEFVTQVLGLPEEKIWATVHPTDADARELWLKKIGLPEERVIDLEENFWTMGDTGPCGPCTELFFDHGPEVAGGPPGSPDEDGDRYIEFWNLVFPQFDRSADGVLTPLPQPGVDTGMGLERVAAIMQGVHSNYEIDMFRSIITRAGSFAGNMSVNEMIANPSLRVIADHIRSSAFLIADGVIPGNEDRSYVLRRIIRRGLRHGNKLGIREPFFYKVVDALVNEMAEAYPLLGERQKQVEDVLRTEEERFSETLNQGMTMLEAHIKQLKGQQIAGETVFQLYDTFGFPADLTADIARERGLTIDHDGFEKAMEEQRSRGRAAASFSTNLGQRISVTQDVEFLGYETLTCDACEVLAAFDIDGEPVEELSADQEGVLVLDKTPFYAESGGQVGDQGYLISGNNRFLVHDTLTSVGQNIHVGRMEAGVIGAGISLSAEVGTARRADIRSNHSATHLLHAALRKVLGSHVEQRGSLVNEEKLRFDFSHTGAVTPDELREIELIVNNEIRANSLVETRLMSYDEALEQGAMALFGEKYGDNVRVLSMGSGFSVELCGGTHVSRTGDIGSLFITAETGIASGVRRIEAVSGLGAFSHARAQSDELDHLAALLKSASGDVVSKVAAMLQDQKALQKRADQFAQELASKTSSSIADNIQMIEGIAVLAAEVAGDNKSMMQTLDTLKSANADSVFVLAQNQGGKVSMVTAVTGAAQDKLSAPDVLNEVGALVGLKGGGRPDLARGGGGDKPEQLVDALQSTYEIVATKLA